MCCHEDIIPLRWDWDATYIELFPLKGLSMNTRKIVQALTYLANKQPDCKLDNMKAYKLLWLADRYQLRQCGRTITGDTYYAMPRGLVPSDAKCLLEDEPTKLQSEEGYRDQFLALGERHSYRAIHEPDLDEFSESDIEALDKVLDTFGAMSAVELSEFSHQFPEWTYYQDLLEDKKRKNSYRVNIDHFFEPCEADRSGLFNQSEELISLTRNLYHQYNRI